MILKMVESHKQASVRKAYSAHSIKARLKTDSPLIRCHLGYIFGGYLAESVHYALCVSPRLLGWPRTAWLMLVASQSLLSPLIWFHLYNMHTIQFQADALASHFVATLKRQIFPIWLASTRDRPVVIKHILALFFGALRTITSLIRIRIPCALSLYAIRPSSVVAASLKRSPVLGSSENCQIYQFSSPRFNYIQVFTFPQ